MFVKLSGKGPLKEYYREKIESMTWDHVRFCLPWLTPEDYPLLLGIISLLCRLDVDEILCLLAL